MTDKLLIYVDKDEDKMVSILRMGEREPQVGNTYIVPIRGDNQIEWEVFKAEEVYVREATVVFARKIVDFSPPETHSKSDLLDYTEGANVDNVLSAKGDGLSISTSSTPISLSQALAVKEMMDK